MIMLYVVNFVQHSIKPAYRLHVSLLCIIIIVLLNILNSKTSLIHRPNSYLLVYDLFNNDNNDYYYIPHSGTQYRNFFYKKTNNNSCQQDKWHLQCLLCNPSASPQRRHNSSARPTQQPMPRVSQASRDRRIQLPPLNPHLPHKTFPPQHLPIVLLSLPLPLPHPRSPLFLSLTLPLPSLILTATFPSSITLLNRLDLPASHFSLQPSGRSPSFLMISQSGRIFCSLVAPFCSSPRGVAKSTI